MKKHLILLALSLILAVSVVACNGNDTPNETTADTTVADTAQQETPSESEEDTDPADTDPAKDTDPSDGTDPEPETTEEPGETTKEPETTEKPEVPTQPPVETDPAELMKPVSVFDADALNNDAGANYIESMTRTDNYLTIIPNASDPHYYPFSNEDGGRYIAIKYRSNAAGTAVQLYIASSGTGPLDDSSMLRQSTIADGQWHIAVFDTESLYNAGIYDYEYVSYFRFDPLECDYKLNEEGNPYMENGTYARYPMPEGASIDVQYIAFFNDPTAPEVYDSTPSYLITYEDLKANADINEMTSSNCIGSATVTDNYVTLVGNGEDAYVTAIPIGTSDATTTKLVALKYRTNVADIGGQFFIGSGNSWTGQGDSIDFSYVADGQWHLLLVDLSGVTALTGAANYMRYDFFADGTNHAIDVQYIAFFDSADQAYAYDAYVNRAPDTESTFQSNVSDHEIGEDLMYSDLYDYFFLEFPTGGCVIEDLGGQSVYAFNVINEMVADMDGAYFVKVNCLASDAAGALVVRGYQNVLSDTLIAEREAGTPDVFLIKNFYESDGRGMFGGSGIYARTDGTNLHINIKTYDPTHYSRIANNVITIPCTDSEITVVDNGSVISIMAGGKTYASIKAEGTVVYDDIKAENCPNGNTFAAKVTVTLLDAVEPMVFENTLVADTCYSQIGVAVRAGTFKFSSIEVGPASAVSVPAIPVLNIREDINAEHAYVADGLVSLYAGVTKDGYWYDLVGKNDLSINANATNFGDEAGLHVDCAKHYFSRDILNVVNGKTFTVEILLGDFTAIGSGYQTFMNSNNDNFALFRRVEGDLLEFKFAANPGDERPKIPNGLELIDNSLVTITYTVGGDMCLYVDGVLLDTKPAPKYMGADSLFIGHVESKAFSTVYKSIRFYNRALTAEEVAANYAVDAAN